ncbi:DUF6247 family protein [Streptomyces sp. NPDC096934]|uniref:DUF6247 family protein n=1 Tax=Streptomyces sp. NPDC096934 TaxID=3155551 RepID=UPI003332AACC
MPERTPTALRAALARHRPKLLPDFDRDWREKIADTFDLAPVPAFMARWWAEFAFARDLQLETKLHRLENEASQATDNALAKGLVEEAGRLRCEAGKEEPGQ